MRDQPGKAGSSKGSRGASNPDDCADAARGEHIRWCGEDVGRPPLVGGCGETEEANCRPRIVGEERVHVRDEHDGKDTQSADQKRELAARVDAVAVLHAEARQPASSDGPDTRRSIDDDKWIFDVAEI